MELYAPFLMTFSATSIFFYDDDIKIMHPVVKFRVQLN